MDVLILLIPMSVALVALIGVAFLWSVRSGQFDDLDGPAHRILADDDAPPDPRRADLTPIKPADAPRPYHRR
jgi:cbb3-type cytochrome oxidase maturation protein